MQNSKKNNPLYFLSIRTTTFQGSEHNRKELKILPFSKSALWLLAAVIVSNNKPRWYKAKQNSKLSNQIKTVL